MDAGAGAGAGAEIEELMSVRAVDVVEVWQRHPTSSFELDAIIFASAASTASDKFAYVSIYIFPQRLQVTFKPLFRFMKNFGFLRSFFSLSL